MAKIVRGVRTAFSNYNADLPVDVVTVCDGMQEYSPRGGDVLEIDRIRLTRNRDRVLVYVKVKKT